MRGFPTLLLLLIMAPALSGCVNPGEKEPAADLGVPNAQMAHDSAAAALALNGTHHVFHGLVGIESIAAGDFLADRAEEKIVALAHDDSTVGDGRTPTWFSFWRAADDNWTVTAEGLAGTQEISGLGSDLYPLGRGFLNEMASRVPIGKGWIDSTRALKVALRTNDDMAEMMERFDVDIVMALHRVPEQTRPVWTIVVSPVQSQERTYAVIDAIDGRPESRYYGQLLIADRHEEAYAQGTPAVVDFTLPQEAGILFIQLERADSSGIGTSNRLHVEITHPDGRLDVVESIEWPRSFAVPFPGAAAGTYQVTATPIWETQAGDAPGFDAVHVHWCAAGVIPDPTGASQYECERFYDYT